MALAFSDAVSSAPIVNCVLIDGVYRPDCRLVSLVVPSGASQAGRALIVFDNAVYGRRTLTPGTNVSVYLDYYRRGASRVFFSGSVLGVNPELSDQMGEAYDAVDARWDMGAVTVRRNYNGYDRLADLPRERLSYREIARRVIADFNEHNPSGVEVILDEHGLSDAESPVQNCEGMAVGAFLDSILDEGSRLPNSSWRVRYNRSTDIPGDLILDVFSEGYGRRRPVQYGVSPSVSARTQGANSGRINTNETEQGMVNRLIGLGGEDIVQHAWLLVEDWADTVGGVSEDEILTNPDRYAKKWDGGDNWQELRFENPNYIKGAEQVGRRYAIPPLDLWDDTTDLEPGSEGSTAKTYPEILDRLADPDQRAFIVYQSDAYDSERYFVKTSGFSVENRRVVFHDPFIMDFTDVGLPEEDTLTGFQDVGEHDDGWQYAFEMAGIEDGGLIGGEIVVKKSTPRLTESRVYSVSDIRLGAFTVGSLTEIEFDLVKTGEAYTDLDEQYAVFTTIQSGAHVTHEGQVKSVSDNGDGTFKATVELFNAFSEAMVHAWAKNVSHNGEAAPKQIVFDVFGETTGQLTVGNIVANSATGEHSPGEVDVVLASPLKDGDVLIDPTDDQYTFYLHTIQTHETFWYKPDRVWLVACYRDTERLTHDTGKQGDGNREIVERAERREFHREYINAGAFTRGENGQVSGVTSEKTLVHDDTERLEEWAEARLKHRMRRGVSHQIVVNGFPTYYEPGDVIRSGDRQIDGRSVRAVEYTGATNRENESGVEVILTVGG